MAIHLRQICLVARELAPVVEDLSAILGLAPCYIDPNVARFGLENALFAIGTNFVEVVAPIEANTAAGRYLDRRGGDGGYMVITQVPTREEQDAVRRNAAANGVRVAHETDRGSWHLMQLHPGDMGASFFEVEWDQEEDVRGNWMPAGGTGWRDCPPSDVVSRIAGAELQGADPNRLADKWAAVAGLPLNLEGDAPVLPLANAALRFSPVLDGRGDGLGEIDLVASNRSRLLARAETRGARLSDHQALICGVRFNFADPSAA